MHPHQVARGVDQQALQSCLIHILMVAPCKSVGHVSRQQAIDKLLHNTASLRNSTVRYTLCYVVFLP